VGGDARYKSLTEVLLDDPTYADPLLPFH